VCSLLNGTKAVALLVTGENAKLLGVYCGNSNVEKSFVAEFMVVIFPSSTIYATIINCYFHISNFTSELEILQEIVEPNTILNVFVGLFSTLLLI
jgi:hypothetical protein